MLCLILKRSVRGPSKYKPNRSVVSSLLFFGSFGDDPSLPFFIEYSLGASGE